MALTGIELSAGIVVGANKPVDAKFGPYASTAAALADIGTTLRYKGLTVGIETGGQVVEYWFRDGVANADLVEKITPLEAENIIGLTDFIIATAPALSSAKTRLTGNGTLRTFTVTGLKSSDPNHVLVAINGVLQEPTTDYTVSQGAGTITFATAIPNNAKIVVVALGLYSPTTQRNPDAYIHAFALNTAGTFSYYGLLLNTDIPGTGSAASVAKWIITRSALSANGTVTSTAQATNVAWANRETATYA